MATLYGKFPCYCSGACSHPTGQCWLACRLRELVNLARSRVDPLLMSRPVSDDLACAEQAPCQYRAGLVVSW